MKTIQVLSVNRTITFWTNDIYRNQTGLKFEHNGATSIYVPLRTHELKKIRDAITKHIKKVRA